MSRGTGALQCWVMASKLLTCSHFDGVSRPDRGIGGVFGDPAGAATGAVVR
ncbi:hypothetical protein ACNO8X_16790 [Mycobacterium sp. PDNC021]|uniref:hypothetical protein n=1 Tax=Mycobacterium sp. PDNC021 TaxID=3391399 RepID=UPI003AAF32CB